MLSIIVLTFLAVTVVILSFQLVCFLQYKKSFTVPNAVEPSAKGYSLVYT